MVRIPTNRTPTHPGEVLLDEFLRPLELTQRDLAGAIGVPYQRVNEVVRGAAGDHAEHGASIGQVLRDHARLLDEPAATVGPPSRTPLRSTATGPDRAVGSGEGSRRRVAGARGSQPEAPSGFRGRSEGRRCARRVSGGEASAPDLLRDTQEVAAEHRADLGFAAAAGEELRGELAELRWGRAPD